jgi:predicted O-methyltransferase YrrM
MKKQGFVWGGEPNFIQLIKNNQSEGMVVVEVGCYDGASTIHFVETVRANKGHIYMIDTFTGTIQNPEFLLNNPRYHNLEHAYGVHNVGLYDWVVETFKPYSDVVTIIKGRSEDIIPTLPDKGIDILFIDADHSYNAVKNDIKLSIPKIKPGGILCGHDCEGFGRVGTYTEYELQSDYVNGHHAGTIQAVYDSFGITQLDGIVWSIKL